MGTTKDDITSLLMKMRCNQILDNDLCDELHRYVEHYDDAVFDNSRAAIQLHFNALLPLEEMNTFPEDYDSRRISSFSNNLLQAMRSQKYSIVELLIKLKLMYIDLLNNQRSVESTNSSLYHQRNLLWSVPSSQDEQQTFTDELTNALLDDIGIYLKESQQSFDKYYTTHTIDELLYLVGHQRTRDTIDSSDMLDRLYLLLMKPMQTKYAPLTGLQMITYIHNQYHSHEEYKYRLLLEKFVETTSPTEFTFAKFYEAAKIKPVFDSKEEADLGRLFRIYCSKLLGIDQEHCPLTEEDFKAYRPRASRQNHEQAMEKANYQNMHKSTRVKKCECPQFRATLSSRTFIISVRRNT